MTSVVHLSSQDTAPSVIARLKTVLDRRVLLVVPPDSRLSHIDLRVIRREASMLGLGLALVTSSARLREVAAREGVSSFRHLGWAKRVRWRRLRSDRLARSRPPGPSEVVAPHAARLFARQLPTGFRPTSFVRAYARRRNPWLGVLGLVLGLLLLFAGLLYAFTLVIPAATITLVPAFEPTELTIPLRAVQDGGANAADGIVPAQVLSEQVSGEARAATTGRRAEPTVKAKGSVTLINRSARQVTAPTGTVVSTATGNNVQFATTAEAVIAPGGRVSVPVEAVLPGPTGNVRAGTITRVEGPLGLLLLVANERNFSGGATAQVGVVTEEDKERLLEQLSQELKKQVYERLKERVEADTVIPEQSVSYLALSPTFTPFVGEVSAELHLRMSMQAVGLSVDLKAAQQVALSRLQQAMPPGTRLISDTIRYVTGPVVMENQAAAFTVSAQGTLLRPIDARAARQAVVGLSPEEAERVLAERFVLAQPPRVSLGPDWLPYIVPTRLPILPWRIRVIVDWDAAARLAAGS